MSNFPDSSDVDLHHPSPTGPGQMVVSQYELNNLYKVYCCMCSDNMFYRDQNMLYRDQNEHLQRHIRQLIYDLYVEKNISENHKDELTSEIVCLQLQNKKLEGNLAAEKLKTERAHCNLVVDNNPLPSPAQFEMDTNLMEDNRKQKTKNAELAEKNMELNNKLKKAETSYKHVCTENKSLKENNDQLLKRVKEMIKEKETAQDVDIKAMGRFIVKSRLAECSLCHESFGSVEEMEQSQCYYHTCPPVPHLEGSYTGKFWSCCQREAKGNKTAPGCQTGQHRLSTKRLKEN